MSYLIEKDGQRQLVPDLSGYDGWAVIEENVEPAPSCFCTRVNGAWVEDAAAKALAEDEARLGQLTPRRRFRMAVRAAQLKMIDNMRLEGLITDIQAQNMRARVDPDN